MPTGWTGSPRVAVEVDFPADHVIARQGEIGTGFFVIVDRRASGSSATARSSRPLGPGRVLRRAVGPRRPAARSPRSSPTDRRPASPSPSWDFEAVLRERADASRSRSCAGWPRRLRDLTEARPALTDRPATRRDDRAARRRRRDRHLPVHRHRGLDAPRAGASARDRYARAARAASRDPARGVRGARRRRAGHRGRLVLRRLPRAPGCASPRPSTASARSPPSRGRTTPRSASGWASTRARPDMAGGQPRRARRQPRGADRGRWRTAARSSLSDATRGLVAATLPAGVALRDLGEHRLKDLRAPERLVQVVADGLPADFPPLADARRAAEQPADPADDVRRARRRSSTRRPACSRRPGC